MLLWMLLDHFIPTCKLFVLAKLLMAHMTFTSNPSIWSNKFKGSIWHQNINTQSDSHCLSDFLKPYRDELQLHHDNCALCSVTMETTAVMQSIVWCVSLLKVSITVLLETDEWRHCQWSWSSFFGKIQVILIKLFRSVLSWQLFSNKIFQISPEHEPAYALVPV